MASTPQLDSDDKNTKRKEKCKLREQQQVRRELNREIVTLYILTVVFQPPLVSVSVLHKTNDE